jgi:hypothetical protein
VLLGFSSDYIATTTLDIRLDINTDTNYFIDSLHFVKVLPLSVMSFIAKDRVQNYGLHLVSSRLGQFLNLFYIDGCGTF